MLKNDLVKSHTGQSCHHNNWWFTVCFSQISYALCPRTIDDSILYGDCEHDRHYLWSSDFIKDFFSLAYYVKCPVSVLVLSKLCYNYSWPARVSFQRYFIKLCARRSSRSCWELCCVLRCQGSCVQHSWLSWQGESWGSCNWFWACTSPGWRIFGRRSAPSSQVLSQHLSGVRSREPSHNLPL